MLRSFGRLAVLVLLGLASACDGDLTNDHLPTVNSDGGGPMLDSGGDGGEVDGGQMLADASHPLSDSGPLSDSALASDSRVRPDRGLPADLGLVSDGSPSDGASSGNPPPQLCTASAQVSCKTLAGVYTAGMATCRTDGSGYDVSSCSVTSGVEQGEMVKPALRDQRFADARCNDGTPFGFQLRLAPSGQRQTWHIFLQGGGYCDDHTANCKPRANLTKYVSSPPEVDRSLSAMPDNRGVMSNDKTENPHLYDANRIFAVYCSSDAWSGRRTTSVPVKNDTRKFYFSGHHNLMSIVDILVQRYGLDPLHPQTTLFFSGASAGAIGVTTNAHAVADRLPKVAAAKKLRILIDGAWFTDWNDPLYPFGKNGPTTLGAVQLMRQAWDAVTDRHCLAAYQSQGKDVARCMLGAEVYPYLTGAAPGGSGLEVFVQLSQLDAFEVAKYGLDLNDSALVATWRAHKLQSLSQVKWLFSGANSYHAIQTRWTESDVGQPGKRFRDFLNPFLSGSAAPFRYVE